MANGTDPLAWTREHSPVLGALAADQDGAGPLDGDTVAVCSSVTTNTGVFVETLVAAGAERVLVTSAGPEYNDPAVIEALAGQDRVETYVEPGTGGAELESDYDALLAEGPDLILDDGCVLTARVHDQYPEVARGVRGGTEQTTVGITRLEAMVEEEVLAYPVYAINDTPMKHRFDNVHGTGESTLTAIAGTTDAMLTGKTMVVAGYGYCGKGIARKARGIGMETVVTEVDPRKALAARMDGHRVLTMDGAAPVGDYFVTATGSVDVVTADHAAEMNDGAFLATAGTAAEIALDDLAAAAERTSDPKAGVTRYHMPGGHRVDLLAGGYGVNLAAPGATGHPAEVIDTTFAAKTVAACDLAEGTALGPGLHDLPDRLDRRVAELAAEAMGVPVDEPTARQREYAADWRHADERK